MQTKLYQCFGLTIRSEMALPCLPAAVGSLEDVYFHVIGVSEMPDMPADIQILGPNECQWRDNTGNWHVHYTDALNSAELHFQVDLNEKRVEVSWTDGVSTVDIPRVILGAICGRLLQWTGKLAMHGNAVQIGHDAVLFCTDSGGGKSTASAALVEAGFPLVCDDIATLKIEAETAYLQPGYPHLRLWPDSAVGLGEHWQDLPTVFRRTQTMGNKCYRDLQHCPELFCAEALPLSAIYLLQTRIPGQNSTEINPISGRQAFPALFANIFQKELLAPESAACIFPVLATVASRTPVFLVRAPEGLRYMPGFADAIAAHSKNLASSKIAY